MSVFLLQDKEVEEMKRKRNLREYSIITIKIKVSGCTFLKCMYIYTCVSVYTHVQTHCVYMTYINIHTCTCTEGFQKDTQDPVVVAASGNRS